MLGSIGILLLSLPVAQGDLAATLLPGESRSSALQYQDFRKYAKAGRWDDALAEYNGLLARPFDLTPLTPQHLLQSRWLAHREMALLPDELRHRLRDQRQAPAQRALEVALLTLDEANLRRIIEEQFGTPASVRAADILGDLAFDRGDFDEADCWYRLILPGSKDSLTSPEPSADPARIRAKQLLARCFAYKRLGRFASLPASLRAELDAFGRNHPGEEGELAGRKGKYAEILKAVLSDRDLEAPISDGIATFGGSAQRWETLPVEEHLADRLSSMTRRPFLRFNLESRREGAGPEAMFATPNPRTNSGMAISPALVGEWLYLADPQYLTGINLHTGKSQELYDAGTAIPGLATERTFPLPDLYRSSVTVAEGHILARFGTVALREARGEEKPSQSVLVCLRLGAEGGAATRWTIKSDRLAGAQFEGAPLVHQGRVYIAVTRIKADNTTTAVACYPLEAQGEVEPLWVRDVCETRELANGAVRRLHHLLTLAGPNVVYCSHSGAIIALDAVTGQRAWGQRYRSAERPNRQALPGSEALPPIHDLAPPVFSGGRVFVAPHDSETLFCLDPWTGAALWQREGIQVVHLLGVCNDRLIFTTPEGLRAVDVRDGGDRTGWMLPDAGRLAPLGRGQIVGNVVLWPTLKGVFAVGVEDGRLVPGPAHLANVPSGNLIYHDGVLASAGRATLTVFKGLPRAPAQGEPGPVQKAQALLEQLDDSVALTTTLDERRRPWPTATLALSHLDKLRRGPQGDAVQALIEEKATPANPLARSTREAALEKVSKMDRTDPAARTMWRMLLRYGEGSQRSAAVRALERSRPRTGTSTLPLVWARGPAVDLEREERLVPGIDRFLTAQPGPEGSRLRLRAGENIATRWHVDLAFLPTWAHGWEEQILVAGSGGLANIREDGKCLWQLVSTEPLDAFQFAEERLLVRVAEGRLQAHDAANGALLWEFGPTTAGLPLDPPYGRIGANFMASHARVFVRTAGQRFLLDAATGRTIRRDPAPQTLAPDDVLALGDRRGLIVAEREQVDLLDLTTGERVWTWSVPGKSTSRMEPLRLLGVGKSVWIQVPVNIGHELHRLDLRTGKPLAELPRLLRGEPFDLSGGRTLGDTVVLLEGNVVVARSALDAAPRWRQVLPPGPARYRVERVGDEILVIPAAGRADATEFHCLLGHLEWKMSYPPATGGLAVAPVLRLDTTTGNAVRLDVPMGLPQLTWKWQTRIEPYLRPERNFMRTSEPFDLHVLPTPTGWRLVSGSRSWNLRSDPRP